MSAVFNNVPHFTTGKFQSHATFVKDELYGLMLDNIVKACTDVLLECEGKLLIGKRNVHPQKDWWFGCGGRMKPGETPPEAVARHLSREVGLVLKPTELHRIEYVGCYSYLWRLRQQPPTENGTADISVVHTLTITEEAKGKLSLCRDEYDDSVWADPEHIIHGNYHPALQRAVGDWTRLQWSQQLERAVADGAGDKEVATIARQLAKLSAETTARNVESAYVRDKEEEEQLLKQEEEAKRKREEEQPKDVQNGGEEGDQTIQAERPNKKTKAL